MHGKTTFAKPSQEGYLGLGQIHNIPRNKKNMTKIENSGIGMFLKELIRAVDMSCKYAKDCMN